MSCVTYFVLFLSVSSVSGGLLKIFVNRINIAEIQTSFIANVQGDASYYYIDGDKVEVTCVRLGNACPLKLKYDFVEKHIGNVSITETRTIPEVWESGVGLRTTLRAAQNHTHMSCECFNDSEKSTVTLTFILQDAIDDVMYLKINDFTLRAQQPTNKLTYLIHYFPLEILTFECQTDVNDVELKVHPYPDGVVHIPTTQTKLDVTPDNEYQLIYFANKKNVVLPIRTVSVVFIQMYHTLKDFQMTFNGSNSSLELYRHGGDQTIYYQYEDGGSLTLTCRITPDLISTHLYYMKFGDKVQNQTNSIIKEIILNPMDDNRSIKCSLYDNRNIGFRHIHVIFLRKNTTMNISTAKRSEVEFPYWIPAMVVSMAFLVLGIAAAICYTKKRSHRKQTSNCKKFENQVSVISKPSHWDSQYSTAVDQGYDDTTYSEIPGTDIPRAYQDGTSSNLNYAVLEVTTSNRIRKTSSCNKSPYAVIRSS